MSSVSFETARTLVLENVPVMESESRPLLKAIGQVASVYIEAESDVPGWAASALDGFAFIAADAASAGPEHSVSLKVVGRVTAGQSWADPVLKGTAVRIMTGAPLPGGADAVIGFEDTRLENGRVAIFKSVQPGANIKPAGEQIRCKAPVLRPGQVIGPAEIGLLASLGQTHVSVYRRPVVAVIASGEELVKPGERLGKAQIFCGDADALAAQVLACGGLPKILAFARDNLASTRRQIRRALNYDLVITTGGSAAGDRDLIKTVMAELGQIIFDGIEMAPGKSTALACLKSPDGRQVPHLALPGVPTAAMLSFEILARPAILKMQGCDCNKPLPAVMAGEPFNNKGPRIRLTWVALNKKGNDTYASNVDSPQSGILQSISQTRAIAVLPPASRIPAGEIISVYPLNWPGQ